MGLKPLHHKKILEKELEGFGIRLNKKPPNISVKPKDKGGINLTVTCHQSTLDSDYVKSILSEFRICNADVVLREDATEDDLIDVVEGNRVYVPCLYVLNKIDQISIEELDIIYKIPHCVRIYTKPKGQLPDYTAPVVLQQGKTSIEQFCENIHKSIMQSFKCALVWGASVKHQPQKVGKEHELVDEDVVQIVKKV